MGKVGTGKDLERGWGESKGKGKDAHVCSHGITVRKSLPICSLPPGG